MVDVNTGNNSVNIKINTGSNNNTRIPINNSMAQYWADRAEESAESAAQSASEATNAKNSILNDEGFIAVSADLDNIDAVAEDLSNINAIAPNLTNINIVATNIEDVNTVATNISNVNSVADDLININSVSLDLTNIDIVAINISDVDTISANVTDVNTVATSISDVNSVADNISAVVAVNDNATNINAVNNNKNNIDTVASISSDVTIVAGVSSDVTTVATNISDVGTVATNISDVGTVANDIINVNAVANDLTNIDAVVSDLTNLDSVAADLTNIDSVAANLTNINAVNSNKTNIDTVAGSLTNIGTVANDIININAVANDLTNIDNASSYADLAEDWATKMDGTVDGTEYSAKYYARQAAQGQIQSDWNQTDTDEKDYIKNKPTIPTVPTNISAFNNDSRYITGITSSDVTTALGYTPYNSTNPNSYTSNIGTVTSVNNTQPDANGNVSLIIPTPATVDQTYDPTSANAQSGVAISGAGFLTSSSISNLANKDLSNLSLSGFEVLNEQQTLQRTSSISDGNLDYEFNFYTSIYKITIASNTTFVFPSNLVLPIRDVSFGSVTFELFIDMSSTVYSLTFPSSVSWQDGQTPDLSTTGKYFLVFRTFDNGTTWFGNLEGKW